MSAPLGAALSYAGHGWRVAPVATPEPNGSCSCGRPDCQRPGKHPRIKDWTRAASTDLVTIRGWWTDWPEANVGIVTGRGSGVVALDIDDRAGGGEALAALEARYERLPVTVEAVTPGGGRHVLFQHPGHPVPNSESRLGAGLDMKGDRGLLVVEPSLHINGGRYRWEFSSHPDEVGPARLPEWLLAELMNGPASDADRRTRPYRGGAPIPEGRRNSTLTQLAGRLKRLVGSEALAAALHAENAAYCRPPLPSAEVEQILRSAERWGEAPPPWLTDPIGFAAEPRLSSPARFLLAAICCHANNDGLAWPGCRRLEALTGIGKNRVRRYVDDELVSAGRIEVLRRSRAGTLYRVLQVELRGTARPPWWFCPSIGRDTDPGRRDGPRRSA